VLAAELPKLREAVLRRLTAEAQPYTVADPLPRSALDALTAATGQTSLQLQVLHNRGIQGMAAVTAFLDRGWRSTEPPLPDLDRAVQRIHQAIVGREPIVVFGDYDTDGMTSCALLVLALRALGAEVTFYIPRRDDDGRGLNAQAVQMLTDQGAKLLITTDCGSANVAEVEQARAMGMEVIITDHHPPRGPLPEGVPIVNPQLLPSPGEHADLSGAGVAFRVAEALLLPAGHQAELEALLDLVAVGTIGDVVPLTGESWALVRAGLTRLTHAPRHGLRALLERDGALPTEVTERDISFMIAPRLNAAARLGQPELSVRLLLADEPAAARALAAQLQQLNFQRQEQLDALLIEAHANLRPLPPNATSPVITIGEGWPLGLLGLVASKLADEYARPAVVISRQEGECRGSARGPEGSHLGDLLEQRAGLFKRFGGHERAAGFTLAADRLDELLDHLASATATHSDGTSSNEATARPLLVDCKLRLEHLDLARHDALRALAPFGPAFPEPVFLCQQVRLLRCWRSGPEKRTLRLRLGDAPGVERVVLWPRRGELADDILPLLPTLPRFDVLLTLGAYQPRPELAPELSPRVLALIPR
jgi:single-stranded-DNA-specific exonuclease